MPFSTIPAYLLPPLSTARRVMLGVTALALVLSACGGGAVTPTGAQPTGGQPTSGQPTSPPIQPTAVATTAAPAGSRNMCDLATSPEVSTAFAFEVLSATPSSDDNYDTCTYASADGSANVTTSISKTALAASMFQSYKSDSSSHAVAGVGDDAVWTTMGLLFLKGGLMVSINGDSAARDAAEQATGSDGYLTAATAIGQAIAGRL